MEMPVDDVLLALHYFTFKSEYEAAAIELNKAN